MWIKTSDNGVYLNTELVERLSVDRQDDFHLLNAHMPSGEAIPISTHSDSAEGVQALEALKRRLES